jgi:hypothetical protein
MDPVTMIIVPGFLGGLVFAMVVLALQRRSTPSRTTPRPYRREPLTTDVINMASIKVAGVGGLGLVAVAAAIALDIPRIFQTIAIGVVLGIGLAAFLILRRRETGSMPSSGRKLGANTTLAIDVPAERTNGQNGYPSTGVEPVNVPAL